MARTASIVALALFAAPAAVQAEQFNLTCSGSLKTLFPAALVDKTEPYAATYRLDLEANKWCEGDCSAQQDIASASPTAFVLQDKKTDTPREHEEIRNIISRVTGDHNLSAVSGIGSRRLAMFWKGKCEKAEFTGFPTPATKF